MQIRVMKADGSIEDYLHTKVLKTFSNVLDMTDQSNVEIAEYLAEVVTYFLYQRPNSSTVTSAEIYSIIQGVMMETDFEQAAEKLHEYHINRQTRRHRIEVLDIDFESISDYQSYKRLGPSGNTSMWNKSRIVEHLVRKYDLNRHTARTIAELVEEKVLNLGANTILKGLIKNLVLAETAAILHAEDQLNREFVNINQKTNVVQQNREVQLEQTGKELCQIGT